MIYDISPFTSLDYPNHLAAIVWFTGCNLRCKYCYNPQIVLASSHRFSIDDALDFLASRKGMLDAVVFSGGECTCTAEIITMAKEVKALGFKLKVDSNGSNPAVLKNLLNLGLIDYVALDFKAPKDKFASICGADFYDEFVQSLHILKTSQIDYEVRTTWHFDLLEPSDILNMHEFLKEQGYDKKYALQLFKDAPNLGDLGASLRAVDLEYFKNNEDFELR